MTILWKDVEQNLTVMLFVFQFYPVCNFGIFISFGLWGIKGLSKLVSKMIKANLCLISFWHLVTFKVISENMIFSPGAIMDNTRICHCYIGFKFAQVCHRKFKKVEF